MADISENKKQHGTPSVKPVGDPPGSESYFGHSRQKAQGATHSASRYGSSPSARDRTAKPVGEPPGSDLYFGRATRPGTESKTGGSVYGAQWAPAPAANTVNIGHAPGSAAYYGDARGRSYGDTMAAPTTHSATRSTGTATATHARTLATVGTLPGTSAYYGSK
jgi:hypothetical protein